MAKEIRVMLVEDDFYARNWMELLLRRDWRTKVSHEVTNAAALSTVLTDMAEHHEKTDLALIDTDISNTPSWLSEVMRCLETNSPNTAVMFTGVEPNPKIMPLLGLPKVVGYVLKDEIRYSLAWAVSLASKSQMVITPGVEKIPGIDMVLPPGTLILDGRKPIPVESLSDLEKKRSRMVFVFSMERREFADEEGISEDYSYGVVNMLYEKLGLNDVLQGESPAEQLFGSHPAVLDHLKLTLNHLNRSKSKKAKDKETLAFHLLTLPVIETFGGKNISNR